MLNDAIEVIDFGEFSCVHIQGMFIFCTRTAVVYFPC